MYQRATVRQARAACTGAKSDVRAESMKLPLDGTCRAAAAHTWPMAATCSPESHVEAVVLPTDFSVEDIQLLHRAAVLADAFETKIILLHVIDINDPAWLSYAGTSDEFMHQLEIEAEQRMRELASVLARRAVEIKCLTVEGLPCEEILNVLTPSSLLLLRKPVQKPFWRLFSKRTAQRVMDEAQCPLVICPSEGSRNGNPQTAFAD